MKYAICQFVVYVIHAVVMLGCQKVFKIRHWRIVHMGVWWLQHTLLTCFKKRLILTCFQCKSLRTDRRNIVKKNNYKQSRNKELEQITKELLAGVKDIFSDDKFIDFLNYASKFPSYSTKNTLLIYRQNPNASVVMGRRTWEKQYNRVVNDNETPIKILAPTKRMVKRKVYQRDPLTNEVLLDELGNKILSEEKINVPSWVLVDVYDAEQTKGDSIRDYTFMPKSAVENFEEMKNAIIKCSDVPVNFKELALENGYCTEKEIIVDNTLPEAMTLKTLVHELAHSKLHIYEGHIELNEEKREVEAESAAYITLAHFGIDTSDYSFKYIGSWSKDKEVEQLMNSLEVIKKTSKTLINEIKKNFENELQRTKAVTRTKEQKIELAR